MHMYAHICTKKMNFHPITRVSKWHFTNIMTDSYAPLSSVVVRALLDKGYDKRRNAGYEVERIVKDFVQKDDFEQVKAIIAVLKNFVLSTNPHSRKGGLIGLASVALGLGHKVIDPFIKDLVTPILPTFSDQNPNVRYYATEALCNVCRVSRAAILDLFHDIFIIIIQLSMETDQNMKSATELLDRVMKDVITESPSFDLVAFIPILREKCLLKNPPAQTQMMLISWVSSLQTAPDIDLVPFLPEIIDGIFMILESPKKEVKKMTEVVIGQFMASIRKKPESVNYTQMINVLIVHAQSQDHLVQRVSLRMILTFIQLSRRTMLPFASGILRAAIPCIAYDEPALQETRSLAEEVNNSLMELITTEDDVKRKDPIADSAAIFDPHSEEKIDVQTIMEVLQTQLMNTPVPCKTTVLRWMYLLNEKTPLMMQEFVEDTFHSLLRTVHDPSDEVVLLALQVLAQISSSNFPDDEGQTYKDDPPKKMSLESGKLSVGRHFMRFLEGLLNLFEAERSILKSRGSFIVRQLCVMLPADDIYRSFAELIKEKKNLSFATVMVETLSTILLTSKELFSLRHTLRFLETEESCDLFVKLYGCWCHSPVATLTLCLLSQCYEQAATLIHIIGDLDITTDTLVELDKLIQMLESPIFSSLRLQLLCPSENKALIEALYGILMIIPQTDAFQMLRCRLNCVPSSQLIGNVNKTPVHKTLSKKIDFKDLLSHFVATQKEHQKFREQAMKERIQSNMLNTSNH